MKKIITIVIVLISFNSVLAQTIKIGVEGNYGMWQRYGNINATIYKGKWFVKPSIKYGNFGKNDTVSVLDGAYSNIEMNEGTFDPNYIYTTFWESTVNRGVSPEIKFGYTFGKEEKRSSFVLAMSFAYYWIKDDFKRHYKGRAQNGSDKVNIVVVSAKEKVKHQNYSVGLSLYYGFKINDKLSLLAGLNIPYYQPIVTDTYDPNKYNSFSAKPLMLNGVNPDYSIGINYKIK